MKSLDTNILLYAANEDCPEHPAALRLLDEALASPHEWILADQVLFEMYVGLRHPQVFAKPLSAGAALERVAFLREKSGFSFCCHQLPAWPAIRAGLALPSFPRRRTYDHVLAVTLKSHGVTEFYTRNVADFEKAECEVLDPFAESSSRASSGAPLRSCWACRLPPSTA
jgi:predicted nucleic acid-binding protein